MKNFLITLFFLLILPFFAYADEREQISLEKAKEIALTHAKLTENEIHSLKIQHEFENNIIQYEIEFFKDDIEYEYAVNAENGKIVKYSYEKNIASITPYQPYSTILPIKEIKEIALSHAKVRQDEARFIKISQEMTHGYNRYELKFLHGDIEYNYLINAMNGEIIEYKVKDYH